jgi:hypothetical protein
MCTSNCCGVGCGSTSSTCQAAYTSPTVTLTNPSNALVDVGQYENFNEVTTGGTANYEVTVNVVNTISLSVVAYNTITSTSSLATNAVFLITSAYIPSCSFEANVVITDAHPTTVHSSYTTPFAVNAALGSLSIAGNALVDSGQVEKIALTWSGGTPTFTGNFVNSGTTFNTIPAISGYSMTNSFIVSASGQTLNTWNCFVVDSATTKVTANSVNLVFGTNAVLAAGTISPATPANLDEGQSLSVGSPTGGTQAYSYIWSSGSCPGTSLGTSSTYLPTASATYYYQVTDSATLPTSACSSGDLVTMLQSLSVTNTVTNTAISGYTTYFVAVGSSSQGAGTSSSTVQSFTTSSNAIKFTSGSLFNTSEEGYQKTTPITFNAPYGYSAYNTVMAAAGANVIVANGNVFVANAISALSNTLGYWVYNDNSITVLAFASGGTPFNGFNLVTSASLPTCWSTWQITNSLMPSQFGGAEAEVAVCLNTQSQPSSQYTVTLTANAVPNSVLSEAAYVYPPYYVTINDMPSPAGTITTNGLTQTSGNTIYFIGVNAITANPVHNANMTTGSYWVGNAFDAWIPSSANIVVGGGAATSYMIVEGNGALTGNFGLVLRPLIIGVGSNTFDTVYPSTWWAANTVNAITPNGAISYVGQGDVGGGERDTFIVPNSFEGFAGTNIPAGSTINYVTIYVSGESMCVGHQCGTYGAVVYSQGLSTTGGAWSNYPGTSYTTISKQWTTNPSTSAAWTIHDIETMEIGAYTTAVGSSPNYYTATVAGIWAYVDYTPAALSAPTIGASNTLLDLGQYQKLTVTPIGGIPPYTVKFYNETSSSVFNTLGSQSGATANTFQVVAKVGGTTGLTWNGVVTDSEVPSVTMHSSDLTVGVNTAISGTASIAPSSATANIDNGQTILLTASGVSGGTQNSGGALTYNWFSGSGGCASGTLITGQTTSTYTTPTLSSTSYYAVNVIDSASTPENSLCSSLDTVTVNGALKPSLTGSSPLTSGQTQTLSGSWTGGTPPFKVEFYNESKGATFNTIPIIAASPATNTFKTQAQTTTSYTWNVIVIDNSYTSPVTANSLDYSFTVNPGCSPTLSNALITFPSNIAGGFAPTANAENVLDSGSEGSDIWVGGNAWTYIANSFAVGNTLWSPTSGKNIGTQLTGAVSGVDTGIPLKASGGNTIYFGTNIPPGQTAAVYAQTINVLLSCP